MHVGRIIEVILIVRYNVGLFIPYRMYYVPVQVGRCCKLGIRKKERKKMEHKGLGYKKS